GVDGVVPAPGQHRTSVGPDLDPRLGSAHVPVESTGADHRPERATRRSAALATTLLAGTWVHRASSDRLSRDGGARRRRRALRRRGRALRRRRRRDLRARGVGPLGRGLEELLVARLLDGLAL